MSDYLRADDSKNGINLMNLADKKELINFVMTKVFCVSQNIYNMSALHKEYLIMVEVLARQVSDRNLVIGAIDNLFKGRHFFAPQPFENLEKVVSKIYDSYLPKETAESGASEDAFDFTDFARIKALTRQYFKQSMPQRNKAGPYSLPPATEPCLEMKLKCHKIWSYDQVWLCLSKDHEEQPSFAGAKHIQDEMAAYEVRPELFEAVSVKLTSEISDNDEEEATKQREECAESIAKYKVTYEEKEKEKEDALKLKIIEDERRRREAIAAREAKKNEPSFGK